MQVDFIFGKLHRLITTLAIGVRLVERQC